MTKEENLQVSVANYMRLQYPNVLFAHIANERQTSPQRGAKLKRMGVKKGMPDVMVFQPNYSKDATGKLITQDYVGLAMELKIKSNKPSDDQLNVLGHLDRVGWKSIVCYSFDEAKTVIDSYLRHV